MQSFFLSNLLFSRIGRNFISTQTLMSSNIRITKTCEYCNSKFEAQKITTKYCSLKCNSKAYKKTLKTKKIKTAIANEAVKPASKLQTPVDYSSIQVKELLTIKETCALPNITDVTLRGWLNDNIITSSRIGKKHLIKRSEINLLL